MKNTQENKLTMYFAVVEVCKKHMSNIQSIPALLAAYNAFLALVLRIEGAVRVVELNVKGLAEDKMLFKREATAKGEALANAIFAYAEVNNDSMLKSSVKYSRSSLFYIRDTTCLERCKIILEIAQANLSNLNDFGVTSAIVQSFQTALSKYELAISKPREATTAKHSAQNDLLALFSEADILLKNVIDKLVSTYVITDSTFFKKYESSRNIIEHGKRVAGITGIIRDAQTGLALSGAKIILEPTDGNSENPTRTTETNENGLFKMKSVKEGSYNLKIEKDEYVRGIEKSDIRRGKTNRVEVGLERSQ